MRKKYKKKGKLKKFKGKLKKFYYFLYKALNLAEIVMAIIWIVFIVQDCMNGIYNVFDIAFVSIVILLFILKHIRW